MRRSFYKELNKKIKDRNIVIWGLGKNIKYAENFLSELGKEASYFADSNMEKQREGFQGKQVLSPESLKKEAWILLTMPKTVDLVRALEQKGLSEIEDFFFLRQLDYYLFASNSADEIFEKGTEVCEVGNPGCSFGVYGGSMRGGGVKKIIVYSFGIGEDVSFSEQLLHKYEQCEIYGFDPTPKSIAYVKNCGIYHNERFTFYPIGLSDQSGERQFYLPKKKENVSGSEVCNSVVDPSQVIKVQMRTLREIMEMLGHQKIDLLKMDIEGSEFGVISQILEEHIEIGQICVEIHDRLIEHGREKRIELVENLVRNHYKLVYLSGSGEELTFVQESIF